MRFGLSFGTMLLSLGLWNTLPNGKSAHFYDIRALKNKHPDWYQQDLKAMVQLLEEGKLQPVINKTLRLDQLVTTHREMEQSRGIGNYILLPGE